MTLPALEYYRPQTMTEGLKLLKEYEGKSRPLAGGTDLLNNMKVGLNPAEVLIDLTGIDGLANIECAAGQPIKIGATATIWDLVHRPEVQANLTALYQAGCGVGAVQHQFMGTIGGNLCQDTRCWYYNQTKHWRRARPQCYKTGGDQCLAVKKSERCHAAFCSDVAPALIALEASITLSSINGTREMPLIDFYKFDGKVPNVLQAGEIISTVTIPATAWQTKSAYIKLRSRKSIDFPQAGVALAVTEKDGKVTAANLALTALGSAPIQIKSAGSIMQDVRTDDMNAKKIESMARECAADAGKEIMPVANMAWRPAYRRRMVEILIEQAMQKVFGR